MRKFTKRLTSVSLAAMMCVGMTACGGKDAGTTAATSSDTQAATEAGTEAGSEAGSEAGTEASSETPAADGELNYASIELGKSYTDLTTTIKWLHHKTDRQEDGTIDKYIAEFNKVYPNITVEVEAITDYAQDTLLRLSTGNWGDIMFIPAIDKAELSTFFIPYGKTADMDNYINFADNWELNGECYGIAYMGNAQGMLYNAKVFSDAGIEELPKTPDELIEDLKLIKEKTDAIPLYTNYAAGWTMGAWDAYLGTITLGDNEWINRKFVHTAEPFKDNGDGTGAYALYKILYDATAEGLIEEDYTTTDWESCKAMLNKGEIGTMVLGSWAVAQMKEAGDHPEDIGYMPFPISVNGVQYATAGPDYSFGISATSDADHQAAAMVFVKWMVEESGWCDFEGGYPISKTAPTTFDFSSATILSDLPALPGEEDFLNNMNAESELSFNAGGNAKIQEIIECAATGSKDFDTIMQEWTKKWNDAQSELGIDVQY